MRTDAFGGAPTAPTAPAPQPAGSPLANASPPSNPPPSPASPPVNPAPVPAAAPTPTPAGKAEKPAKAEPHMPKVGSVKDDGTGKPVIVNPAPADATPTSTGPANPKATEGDNSGALDAQLASLLQEVEELGNASGQGANSLGELALVVCQAAKNGIISISQSSEDVANIFAKYREGVTATRLDATSDQEAEKNDKFHVSRLRQFAKLGAAEWTGNAPLFLSKARETIGKIDRKDTGMSTYSALGQVCRAMLKQIKGTSDKGKSKCKALTETQIRALLIKQQDNEDLRSDNEIARDDVRALATKVNKLIGGTDDKAAIDTDALKKVYAMLNAEVARYEALIAKEPKAE